MGALQFHSPLRLTIKMVNVPKSRRTYCKKCKTHKVHKVRNTRSLRNAVLPRVVVVTTGNSRVMVDRRNPSSERRPRPPRIVLRMECTDCKVRKQIPLKRCKHFELGGDKKRKGQMIQF